MFLVYLKVMGKNIHIYNIVYIICVTVLFFFKCSMFCISKKFTFSQQHMGLYILSHILTTLDLIYLFGFCQSVGKKLYLISCAVFL